MQNLIKKIKLDLSLIIEQLQGGQITKFQAIISTNNLINYYTKDLIDFVYRELKKIKYKKL